MTIVFKNPPLVELMAELRWGAPTVGLMPGGSGMFAFPAGGNPQQLQIAFASSYEAFFMRFAVEAHKMGFTIQERIVPPNTALMPFQTVWRWKKPDVDALFLQLGVGVFTVNGGPPAYTHWDDQFVTTVQDGVRGLIAAIETYPEPRPTAFGQTLLRYIDLFDSESVKDSPPLAFFRDVMGLKIDLPDTISKFATDNVLPHLGLQVPISDGVMSLTFTHGVVAGRSGHVFDSTVTRNAEVPFDAAAVAENFTASHAITNEMFMALTKPLHGEMEPIK
ncbi:TIGR04255 family protein [Paraburkholderia sp. J7]|uniref:TIGR04255 family protein n=1 Tax=Paraburkholderia sp. J7 TaxID=2805438 RepID=UPI002AB7BBA2|nr:TIGR04255 family protein [Paraburkholderia sp. J7]